jgi:UDP-glucose 4-epimerase
VHVKGSLDRYRDLVFVEDVVEVWCRLLRLPLQGHTVVNVGTGRRTTVGELLQAIAVHVPGATSYSEGGTPGDQHGIFADTTRLRQVTGKDHFMSLDDGLGRFIEWARQHVSPGEPSAV